MVFLGFGTTPFPCIQISDFYLGSTSSLPSMASGLERLLCCLPSIGFLDQSFSPKSPPQASSRVGACVPFSKSGFEAILNLFFSTACSLDVRDPCLTSARVARVRFHSALEEGLEESFLFFHLLNLSLSPP